MNPRDALKLYGMPMMWQPLMRHTEHFAVDKPIGEWRIPFVVVLASDMSMQTQTLVQEVRRRVRAWDDFWMDRGRSLYMHTNRTG